MEEKNINEQIKEFLKRHPEISQKLKEQSDKNETDNDESSIISSLTDLFGEVTSGLIGF